MLDNSGYIAHVGSILINGDLKVFPEWLNFTEDATRKSMILTFKRKHIQNPLLGCFTTHFKEIMSYSIKTGFDRKIYFHNITRITGSAVKYSDFNKSFLGR